MIPRPSPGDDSSPTGWWVRDADTVTQMSNATAIIVCLVEVDVEVIG